MSERTVDAEQLKEKALEIVAQLRDVAYQHQRTYPAEIEAVLVCSGPGTYYDRLKPGQEEWERWMDRDRVRAGAAIVREVTASKISDFYGREIRSNHVTKGGVLEHGPMLVYNGVPIQDPILEHENEIFRRAVDSPYCKIPRGKVLVIDVVKDTNSENRPLYHTGDQIMSLFQEIANPDSRMYRIKNVAIVSDFIHFVRIPFYCKKYGDEYTRTSGKNVNLWFYGIKCRPGTEEPNFTYELPRLVRYAELGYLAVEPSPFKV